MLKTIKKIFKYLIATCEDCKHCDECAENGFMCGFVGGVNPNYFEFKESKYDRKRSNRT